MTAAPLKTQRDALTLNLLPPLTPDAALPLAERLLAAWMFEALLGTEAFRQHGAGFRPSGPLTDDWAIPAENRWRELLRDWPGVAGGLLEESGLPLLQLLRFHPGLQLLWQIANPVQRRLFRASHALLAAELQLWLLPVTSLRASA